mgnify:CR=1 FL=1
MFFVIWSKRVGGRADAPLMDYWQAFEYYSDAARLYAALLDDGATYTATITGGVIESTDYTKTWGGRNDR